MQKFTNRVTEVLDKYAPVRIIQVRRKYAPWLSDQTKDAINIRNQAQQMANLIKTPENIRAYKNVRNKVNNMLKRDKANWEKEKLNYENNSSSDLWQYAKQIMNCSTNGPPSQLLVDGKLVNKPKELSSIMNSFFYNSFYIGISV